MELKKEQTVCTYWDVCLDSWILKKGPQTQNTFELWGDVKRETSLCIVCWCLIFHTVCEKTIHAMFCVYISLYFLQFASSLSSQSFSTYVWWSERSREMDILTYFLPKPVLWCHCYNRPPEWNWKCFGTHTDTVETLFCDRLFQHVVSECKAKRNRKTFCPPRMQCNCDTKPERAEGSWFGIFKSSFR